MQIFRSREMDVFDKATPVARGSEPARGKPESSIKSGDWAAMFPPFPRRLSSKEGQSQGEECPPPLTPIGASRRSRESGETDLVLGMQMGAGTGTVARKGAPEPSARKGTVGRTKDAEAFGTRSVSFLAERFPARQARQIPRTFLSFLAFVLIPGLALGAYLYLFASPQYVSETRFQVIETIPVPAGGALPGALTTTSSVQSQAASGMSMLGGAMISSGSPQNFVVVDFLTSREAVEELQKRIDIMALYSKPEIDWWNRFSTDGSLDDFLEYWRSVAFASYDPVTGLAVARVRAFSAADAYLISKTLVAMAEELVNRIAQRYQTDAVRYAEAEVQRARERLEVTRKEVLNFRTTHEAIDPGLGVVPANVDLAKSVKASIIQQEAELATLLQQKVDPNSALAQSMAARILSTKEQLARVEREVSRGGGNGAKALAEIMSKFEKLDLERQYAQALLLGALQAYDQARAFAGSQHLYLTPYGPPSLPQKPTLPKKALTLFLGIICLAAAWICGLLIYRAIAGHVH